MFSSFLKKLKIIDDWIPACAGMTELLVKSVIPRLDRGIQKPFQPKYERYLFRRAYCKSPYFVTLNEVKGLVTH